MKHIKLFEEHEGVILRPRDFAGIERVIVCARDLEGLDKHGKDFCYYDSYSDPLDKKLQVQILFSFLTYSHSDALTLNLALQKRAYTRHTIFAEGSFLANGTSREVINKGGDASYMPILRQALLEDDFFTKVKEILHTRRGQTNTLKYGV